MFKLDRKSLLSLSLVAAAAISFSACNSDAEPKAKAESKAESKAEPKAKAEPKTKTKAEPKAAKSEDKDS